jgi:hypothetical protein
VGAILGAAGRSGSGGGAVAGDSSKPEEEGAERFRSVCTFGSASRSVPWTVAASGWLVPSIAPCTTSRLHWPARLRVCVQISAATGTKRNRMNGKTRAHASCYV